MASAKKLKLMEIYKKKSHQKVEVILVNKKDPDAMKQVIQFLKKKKMQKVGVFQKEEQKGVLIDAFNNSFAKLKLGEEDVSKQVQALMQVKDKPTLEMISASGKGTSLFMQKFIKMVEHCLETGKTQTH